jgi:hypothetical protein
LHTREFFSVGVLELMDAGHQGFNGLLFFGSGLCVPGSTPLNFLGSFKWRDTIILRGSRFVLDVQPFLAPPLDRVREFHVEVINVGTDADTNATYIVGDVPRVVAPEIENAFP